MPEQPHKPPTALLDEERDLPPVLHDGPDPLPKYAELHCISNFSFQRGASHPQELVRRAYDLGYEALAITELKPKAGFYDYAAKYTDGLTEHVCPAEIPDDIAQSILDMAAKAHRILGCKGASRSDFRWDDEQGEAGVYLLEVNTQPGMTPLSLVPEQAKLRGIAYGELVERLIEEALQ